MSNYCNPTKFYAHEFFNKKKRFTRLKTKFVKTIVPKNNLSVDGKKFSIDFQNLGQYWEAKNVTNGGSRDLTYHIGTWVILFQLSKTEESNSVIQNPISCGNVESKQHLFTWTWACFVHMRQNLFYVVSWRNQNYNSDCYWKKYFLLYLSVPSSIQNWWKK